MFRTDKVDTLISVLQHKTVAEIVQLFKRLKVYGVQKSFCWCQIATYIMRYSEIYVNVDLTIITAPMVGVWGTPTSLRCFIDDCDSGRYPELEAEIKVPQVIAPS